MSKYILGVVVLSLLAFSTTVGATAPVRPSKAAIFVENRAGKDYDDKIDVLNDLISTRMTDAGFSIVDKAHAIDTLRKSKSAETKALGDSLDRKGKIEESLSDSGSALRIAQMLQADYLLIASITSVGKETKRFKADEVSTENIQNIVRVSIKLLEGNQGGTIYGDVVKITKSFRQTEYLKTESDDLLNSMLDEAASIAAQKASANIEKIRSVVVDPVGTVEFTVKCNVPDASVELDGTAIGSTGPQGTRFRAAPGLHQVRISREWFQAWEKTINVFDGQALTPQLELSREGLERFKNLETFKAEMKRYDQETELTKKQVEAEVYRKMKESDANAEYMRNSYNRLDSVVDTKKKNDD